MGGAPKPIKKLVKAVDKTITKPIVKVSKGKNKLSISKVIPS